MGAVADPRLAEQLRVRVAYDHGYGVLRWEEPSPTVAGGSHPGQGAYAVSDLRLKCKPWETSGAYGVLRWDDAIGTVTGSAQLDNGTFAVSDPRRPASVGEVPIIIAADETWHRPLTTLELAALQGLPTIVRGEPIRLVGDSVSAWRERIGNAVPPPTAQAIAERMLAALLEADAGAISLSGNHDVWVEPNRAEVC